MHLHCYQYHRKPAKELEQYCASVHYYRRKKGIRYIFGELPYIVSTRCSEELARELLKDDHPILFEGIHTCFLLGDPRFQDRIKLVRAHNVEHDYYRHLASVEKSLLRRMYFKSEARKLEKFEKMLSRADKLLAISAEDMTHFASLNNNTVLLPAFHPHDEVRIEAGRGDFAFYHGNLSIGENNEAALYLVRNVFRELPGVRLVIAGSKPSRELVREAKKYPNIDLRADISTQEIYALVRKAQVNILPTFQATGIKLKLLAVLFTGRHCIVNSPMVTEPLLKELCTVADTADAMKEEILRLMEPPFSTQEIERRKKILSGQFSNQKNAKKLAVLLP